MGSNLAKKSMFKWLNVSMKTPQTPFCWRVSFSTLTPHSRFFKFIIWSLSLSSTEMFQNLFCTNFFARFCCVELWLASYMFKILNHYHHCKMYACNRRLILFNKKYAKQNWKINLVLIFKLYMPRSRSYEAYKLNLNQLACCAISLLSSNMCIKIHITAICLIQSEQDLSYLCIHFVFCLDF